MTRMRRSWLERSRKEIRLVISPLFRILNSTRLSSLRFNKRYSVTVELGGVEKEGRKEMEEDRKRGERE